MASDIDKDARRRKVALRVWPGAEYLGAVMVDREIRVCLDFIDGVERDLATERAARLAAERERDAMRPVVEAATAFGHGKAPAFLLYQALAVYEQRNTGGPDGTK